MSLIYVVAILGFLCSIDAQRNVNGTSFRFRFVLDTTSREAYAKSNWDGVFTKNANPRSFLSFEKTLVGMISNFTGVNITRRTFTVNGPNLFLNFTVRYQPRLALQHQEARGRFLTLLRQGPTFWNSVRNYINSQQRVYTSSVILSQIDELQPCRRYLGSCWVKIGSRLPNHMLTSATLLQITLDTPAAFTAPYTAKTCDALANDAIELVDIREQPRAQVYHSYWRVSPALTLDCFVAFYFRAGSTAGAALVTSLQATKRLSRVIAVYREARITIPTTMSVKTVVNVARNQFATIYNVSLAVNKDDWSALSATINDAQARSLLTDNLLYSLYDYLQLPVFLDPFRASVFSTNKVAGNRAFLTVLVESNSMNTRQRVIAKMRKLLSTKLSLGGGVNFTRTALKSLYPRGFFTASFINSTRMQPPMRVIPPPPLPINATSFRFRFVLDTTSREAYAKSSWIEVFPKNSNSRSFLSFEKTLVGMISNFTGVNITRRSFSLNGPNLFFNFTVRYQPRLALQHQEARGRFLTLIRQGPTFWMRLQQYVNAATKKIYSRSVVLAQIQEQRWCTGRLTPQYCWVSLPVQASPNHLATKPVLVKVSIASPTIPNLLSNKLCIAVANDAASFPFPEVPRGTTYAFTRTTASLDCYIALYFRDANSGNGVDAMLKKSGARYSRAQAVYRESRITFPTTLVTDAVIIPRSKFANRYNVTLMVTKGDWSVLSPSGNPVSRDLIKENIITSLAQDTSLPVFINPFTANLFARNWRSNRAIFEFTAETEAFTAQVAVASYFRKLSLANYFITPALNVTGYEVGLGMNRGSIRVVAINITNPRALPFRPVPTTTAPPTTTVAPTTTTPPTTTGAPTTTASPDTTTTSPGTTASPGTTESPSTATPAPTNPPVAYVAVDFTVRNPAGTSASWSEFSLGKPWETSFAKDAVGVFPAAISINGYVVSDAVLSVFVTMNVTLTAAPTMDVTMYQNFLNNPRQQRASYQYTVVGRIAGGLPNLQTFSTFPPPATVAPDYTVPYSVATCIMIRFSTSALIPKDQSDEKYRLLKGTQNLETALRSDFALTSDQIALSFVDSASSDVNVYVDLFSLSSASMTRLFDSVVSTLSSSSWAAVSQYLSTPKFKTFLEFTPKTVDLYLTIKGTTSTLCSNLLTEPSIRALARTVSSIDIKRQFDNILYPINIQDLDFPQYAASPDGVTYRLTVKGPTDAVVKNRVSFIRAFKFWDSTLAYVTTICSSDASVSISVDAPTSISLVAFPAFPRATLSPTATLPPTPPATLPPTTAPPTVMPSKVAITLKVDIDLTLDLTDPALYASILLAIRSALTQDLTSETSFADSIKIFSIRKGSILFDVQFASTNSQSLTSAQNTLNTKTTAGTLLLKQTTTALQSFDSTIPALKVSTITSIVATSQIVFVTFTAPSQTSWMVNGTSASLVAFANAISNDIAQAVSCDPSEIVISMYSVNRTAVSVTGTLNAADGTLLASRVARLPKSYSSYTNTRGVLRAVGESSVDLLTVTSGSAAALTGTPIPYPVVPTSTPVGTTPPAVVTTKPPTTTPTTAPPATSKPPATPSPPSTPSPPVATPNNTPNPMKVPEAEPCGTGCKAAAVVGVIGGLGIMIAIAYVVFVQRQRTLQGQGVPAQQHQAGKEKDLNALPGEF